VFLFERVARDGAGCVVEFVVSVYRGDRYKLTAELHAPRTRAGTGRQARAADAAQLRPPAV
jgi:hypothetical protein